jgi:hypothetical protein
LESQSISQEFLTEHFAGLFQNFMINLTTKNYAGLEKIVESRFLK